MSTLTGTHGTPVRMLGTARQKSTGDMGWLSHVTYEGLPPRFQKVARMLKEQGELIIEGMP